MFPYIHIGFNLLILHSSGFVLHIVNNFLLLISFLKVILKNVSSNFLKILFFSFTFMQNSLLMFTKRLTVDSDEKWLAKLIVFYISFLMSIAFILRWICLIKVERLNAKKLSFDSNFQCSKFVSYLQLNILESLYTFLNFCQKTFLVP